LIRDREAELKNIVETMVEGVAIFDAQGRITMVNAASERILGARREEIVGRHYTDVPWRRETPAGAPLAEDQHPFARLAAGAERIENAEFAIRSSAGKATTIQVNAAPIRDPQGAFAGMVATYEDVTEQRRAESLARAAQERLERALEGSRVALFEVEVATGHVYLSESWSLMRGGPAVATETTVNALVHLTHPEDRDRMWNVAMQALRGDIPHYEYEHRVSTVSGDWIWIISRGRVIERDAAGRVVRIAGTNVDVTEQARRAAHPLPQHARCVDRPFESRLVRGPAAGGDRLGRAPGPSAGPPRHRARPLHRHQRLPRARLRRRGHQGRGRPHHGEHRRRGRGGAPRRGRVPGPHRAHG
jgi:PAS domain S-box-containing protein